MGARAPAQAHRLATPIVVLACLYAVGARAADSRSGQDIALDVEALPLSWQRYDVLLQSAGDGEPDDNFGGAVALAESFAIVGASEANGATGRAFLFSRQGGGWSSGQPLAPASISPGAQYGFSVAASGGVAVVGARRDAETGRVYVFENQSGTWKETVLSSDASGPGDLFGSSVAVSGHTVVIGAPLDSTLDTSAGAAYVFEKTGESWQVQPTLLAADETEPGTRVGHLFGTSVAIENDTIVVGAPYEAAAHVFERIGGTWTRKARLKQSEPQDWDQFGVAASIHGDVILVGADLHDDAGHEDAGAAYVFQRSAGAWDRSQTLAGDPALDGAGFGFQVRVGDGALMISAPYGDPGNLVHTFVHDPTLGFSSSGVLASQGLNVGDTFGYALAMFGKHALVGVPNGVGELGSAHVFAPANGSACEADSGCALGHCSEGVCCDRACDGNCESCLASRKARGPSGACGFVAENTDPRRGCAPATCLDASTEDPADVCDGAGECRVTPGRSCNGYACSVSACSDACFEDSVCNVAAGFSCIDGRCLVAAGGPCDHDAACESQHCSRDDGVCCATACSGACESCLASKKGAGVDGVCGPVPAGSDPDDECEAESAGSGCGATGTCNGKAQCWSYAPPTAPCGDTTCVDGVVRGQLCSGDGRCRTTTIECDRFGCSGDACAETCTADSDCQSGNFCGAGKCLARRGRGADCGSSRECATAHCVDSICDDAPRCSADGQALVDLENVRHECAPFTCRDRHCLEACDVTLDCTIGFACNPNNHNCEQVTARTAQGSACSVGFKGSGAGLFAGAILTFALLRPLRRQRLARRVKEERGNGAL